MSEIQHLEDPGNRKAWCGADSLEHDVVPGIGKANCVECFRKHISHLNAGINETLAFAKKLKNMR